MFSAQNHVTGNEKEPKYKNNVPYMLMHAISQFLEQYEEHSADTNKNISSEFHTHFLSVFTRVSLLGFVSLSATAGRKSSDSAGLGIALPSSVLLVCLVTHRVNSLQIQTSNGIRFIIHNLQRTGFTSC